MLTAMGIEAFAERARRELMATGVTVSKRSVAKSQALTAQEAHIARLARDGLSNPEIGNRLFISARTVKYHLSKVYTKLSITSREQLEHVLPAAPAAAGPSRRNGAGRRSCPRTVRSGCPPADASSGWAERG